MRLKSQGLPAALLLTVMIGGGALAQEQQQQDISAPVGEEGAAVDQGIPRQDPSQYQQAPQSSFNVAPGQQVSDTQPNLPPRELTREELEKIRQGMVDRTEGMILRPNEVGRIRDATLGSQSAAVRPTYSNDPYPMAQPRVVSAAKTPMQVPPTVRMAYGLTTSVTFVDSGGHPWPIANVTYNPQMLAQDGAGCGNAGAQNGEASERPTTINLTPCFFEVFGNINVALDKWPYPIVLLTQSGFRPNADGARVSVDMPLTVVIEGRSPIADKVRPVSLAGRDKPSGSSGGRRSASAQRPAPKAVEGELAGYIVGRPPRGASAVTLDGAPDVRGYASPTGDLIVVGRVEMLTPNFAQRASTPDGETAYRFKGMPYRLLLSDPSGVERPATVRY